MALTNPYMQRLFCALVCNRREPCGTYLEGFMEESLFYLVKFAVCLCQDADRYVFPHHNFTM